jgi:hypothetical protein
VPQAGWFLVYFFHFPSKTPQNTTLSIKNSISARSTGCSTCSAGHVELIDKQDFNPRCCWSPDQQHTGKDYSISPQLLSVTISIYTLFPSKPFKFLSNHHISHLNHPISLLYLCISYLCFNISRIYHFISQHNQHISLLNSYVSLLVPYVSRICFCISLSNNRIA